MKEWNEKNTIVSIVPWSGLFVLLLKVGAMWLQCVGVTVILPLKTL